MQTVDKQKVSLIVKKRHLGYTFNEIGQELGISHQRVHQLYKLSKSFESTYNKDHEFDDWEDIYQTRENSLYYSILIKQYGKEKADYIWDCRNFDLNIWNKVKNYKVRDPLCLVGEEYQGHIRQ